ncbi:MAG TPA: alpha-L-arabinofuranosidase, partial [Prolixibacteraceae bacterium]|nr:alpha-L-arabinofuranosidase [Prolixibacteraceae bacterium]
MKPKMSFVFLLLSFLMTGSVLYSQTAGPITVKVDQPTSPIQPTMWGIFFEDINMAADGGIYAELVKNRSFEFFQPQMGWKVLKKDTTEGVL